MQIWFVITQKGGAGKTTVVTNLAVCAAEQNKKVLIGDLDPQETTVKWWQSREEDKGIQAVKVPQNVDQVKKVLDVAKLKGFDLLIFDTVGQDTRLHNAIIELATLCIVPCQPSLPDIRAVKSTIGMLEKKDVPFVFLITRCPPVGHEFEKTKQGLSAHGLVCPTPTIERKAYKNAYALGLGVSEYDPKDKAVLEMNHIFQWITKAESKLTNREVIR